jgi:hypothetical protein
MTLAIGKGQTGDFESLEYGNFGAGIENIQEVDHLMPPSGVLNKVEYMTRISKAGAGAAP